jgi:hypothetical protein
MTSGGARARSGPAPDPNALRRDRADDKGWTTLPVEGFNGVVPEFPLPKAIQFDTYFEQGKKVTEPDFEETEDVWDAEQDLWAELWLKPQAFMWSKLGMKFQVAAYVRAFLESVEADAAAGLKTAVLRMEAELGVSLIGMNALRWKFSEDQLEAKRSAPVTASSARERLKALNGAG